MSQQWIDRLELGAERWTLLVQSPESTWWALFEDGRLATAPFGHETCDVGLPLGVPFEVTAFDGHGRQKRWVSGHEPQVLTAGDEFESRILLWGTAQSTTGGWTVMAESRVGRYPIPAEIPAGHRAALRIREVTSADENRNATIASTVFMEFGDAS